MFSGKIKLRTQVLARDKSKWHKSKNIHRILIFDSKIPKWEIVLEKRKKSRSLGYTPPSYISTHFREVRLNNKRAAPNWKSWREQKKNHHKPYFPLPVRARQIYSLSYIAVRKQLRITTETTDNTKLLRSLTLTSVAIKTEQKKKKKSSQRLPGLTLS